MMTGEIVVDGVQMSCYTRAVESNAAHSLLAPVRVLFRMFSKGFALTHGASEFFADVSPSGAIEVL